MGFLVHLKAEGGPECGWESPAPRTKPSFVPEAGRAEQSLAVPAE